MPQSIAIGFLVLGGVLLLAAIIGGNFKIFGAEVQATISSVPLRLFSGVLGLTLVTLSPFLIRSGGSQAAANTPEKKVEGFSGKSSALRLYQPSKSVAEPGPAAASAPPKPEAAPEFRRPSHLEVKNPEVQEARARVSLGRSVIIRDNPSVTASVLCKIPDDHVSFHVQFAVLSIPLSSSWYRTDACNVFSLFTGFIRASDFVTVK